MGPLFEAANGVWIWWIAAGIMLAIELAAPGVFFLWLALAAATVGAIVYVWPLEWLYSVPLFAALSLIYVYLGRPYYGRRSTTDQPHLNQRHYNYVGRTYTLTEPIANGQGKLTIEDTVWDVAGPDLAAGSRVKIAGIEGLVLKIEAA
jgi:inner membrane protein